MQDEIKLKSITKRLNITSLDDAVEQALMYLPIEDRSRLKEWLQIFAKQLLFHFVFDVKKGAERGIEEIANLIENPDYYNVVKRRRNREAERAADQAEKNKLDRFMRTGFATREELQEQLDFAAKQVVWYDQILVSYTQQRAVYAEQHMKLLSKFESLEREGVFES